ncbi:MAG: SLC13 family permease [Verrucomicrobiales bacterium]|nr:SLC13 family permease [Verrucomicrobiales bacterium]
MGSPNANFSLNLWLVGELIQYFSVHWQMFLVFGVLVFAMLAFFREWLPPDMVAMFSLGIILLPGLFGDQAAVLGRDDLLGAFSNAAPLTIACMFVLSAGLEKSGCIRALGSGFRRVAGVRELRVLVILMVTGAVLSAFVNNTPVVVVFLPIVLSLARSSELKASRLLIPLSFACILGGTCTLTGTSTNLIIDGKAQELGLEPFTMFELTKLGVVYAAIGFVYMLTVGRKLLPAHDSQAVDLSCLEEREFLTQVIVQGGSPMTGKTLPETLFREIKEARVLEVRRRGTPLATPLNELVIEEGDRILISVHGEEFQELKDTEGLLLTAYQNLKLETLEKRPALLMEGIIGPMSRMIGKSLRELKFRQRFGVLILGIHRQSGEFRKNFEDVRIQAGDSLLIEGPRQAIAAVQAEKDFVSLSEPPEQPIRKGKVLMAAGITLGFILAATLTGQPIVVLALLAALAMLATRCLDPADAYNAVSWNIIFLIIGMLGVGKAMEVTGGAQLMADGVMAVFGESSPVVVLAAVYLLSSILTELISNNAVAVLLTPIIISIALALGVDARPFIVAMMFGCSASFATPIGYQTNTYVYGAGGYKFSDFLRVGVPLNLILWLVATWLIPKFWPF